MVNFGIATVCSGFVSLARYSRVAPDAALYSTQGIVWRFLSAAAEAAFGSIDILVVASGMNDVSPIVDMAPERFDKVMQANVDGAWLIARAVGRRMVSQKRGGKVVFNTLDYLVFNCCLKFSGFMASFVTHAPPITYRSQPS